MVRRVSRVEAVTEHVLCTLCSGRTSHLSTQYPAPSLPWLSHLLPSFLPAILLVVHTPLPVYLGNSPSPVKTTSRVISPKKLSLIHSLFVSVWLPAVLFLCLFYSL